MYPNLWHLETHDQSDELIAKIMPFFASIVILLTRYFQPKNEKVHTHKRFECITLGCHRVAKQTLFICLDETRKDIVSVQLYSVNSKGCTPLNPSASVPGCNSITILGVYHALN